ncbi:tRNA uridine-5-carboxymethylaminomethyl(34) synthesis GTPase MnmE [Hansschlegelia beijingensis]|uniref:tRNA uridine-5-carboxymethylaminomethyl(34) synthesis GTPase MnmE n=1 Tax=Hansschlegelia beijingensis TaxID=1133344 RepID=UPI00387F34FE
MTDTTLFRDRDEASPRADEPRDTIVALSTAAGRAAVAVVRLSGPQAGPALEAIAGSRPAARRASYRTFRRPGGGEVIDTGLALWLPGPASATGEDVAELHIHGGRAVVAATLEAALSVPGVRMAEPGEFTRRAFLAGRMDLAEVEGLADLIEAETEAQRRQALRQSSGELSARVEAWRERLIGAMALLEAAIDFSDEDDVPAGLRERAQEEIERLAQDLSAALADTRAERLRDGFRVALVGPPNAGKSSLLNLLARREAAIVADAPGTTRDVIETHLDLGGVPVIVADTAGLRESSDAAEQEGVRRSTLQARTADLVIWLEDAANPTEPSVEASGELWRVANKADLAGAIKGGADHLISVRSGGGVEELIAALTEAARAGTSGEALGLTRARHRDALGAAVAALRECLDRPLPEELAAELLRRAAGELGRITGKVGVEDVLDRVFASFCIGK